MRRTSTIDTSLELLSELKAFQASGSSLNEIDERRVRSLALAISENFKKMVAIESNPFLDPSELFAFSAIRFYQAKYLREKRCLLSYLLSRLQKIANSWWKTEDHVLGDVLHSAEAIYLQELDDTMVDYMTTLPLPLDLRSFLWRPPSSQQLEVRGIKNYFWVSPISGETISIYTGKQFLLHFEEAEPLIKQGVVEVV